MKSIVQWLNESAYLPPLSPGCEMCAHGSKLVVLITGKCPSNCYYCPISYEKGGTDRIFADEWELENEEDVEKLVKEAHYIQATGAGITGGDPLVVIDRTMRYISLLKDNFGSSFHIHLYTSGLKNINRIEELAAIGLDEIRFHPHSSEWNMIKDSPLFQGIQLALDTSMDVALEIPSIPEEKQNIISLITWANEIGIKWINLNELEFSERNAEVFISRSYTVKNDISAAVRGSQKTAIDIIQWASERDLRIGVHYCSSSFKDGVQLTNRIKRRALNTAKNYEVISGEGTIIKGVIYPCSITLNEIVTLIKKGFMVPEHLFEVNEKKKRIEIAGWILEKIVKNLDNEKCICYIVEEYPTADHLEVERIPLTSKR